MSEKKDVNIDSTNIFDEFDTDEKLKNEIESAENEKKKDTAYYMSIVSNIFTVLNLIFFLLVVVLGGYIYIQNSTTIKDASYLNLVCKYLVDDKGEYENCSSVSSLISDYNEKNKSIKNNQYKKVLPLVEEVYKNKNFIDSKEVNFLINKSKDKLRVLKMLSDFDKLKNDFSPLIKTKIKCENIKIGGDSILEIQCSAYSGVWDGKILGYSGKNKGKNTVNGTSISLASSFINFIEQYKINGEQSPFYILEKPKKFGFVEIVNNNGYTRKTDFKLKLKYSNILLQNK